jgi:chaperonin GroES
LAPGNLGGLGHSGESSRTIRRVTKPVAVSGTGNLRVMAPRATERNRDTKQSIRMTADRVLVLPSDDAGDRKSRGGILIPATANLNRRLTWAEVVAVGPTVRNLEEGDRVLFAPDAGFEVEIRGEEYLILRERDVHAVASARVDGQTGLYL